MDVSLLWFYVRSFDQIGYVWVAAAFYSHCLALLCPHSLSGLSFPRSHPLWTRQQSSCQLWAQKRESYWGPSLTRVTPFAPPSLPCRRLGSRPQIRSVSITHFRSSEFIYCLPYRQTHKQYYHVHKHDLTSRNWVTLILNHSIPALLSLSAPLLLPPKTSQGGFPPTGLNST